ncbi:MAG: MATE family efflux transporter [Christensenellales bacterium]|jgi:multidrug efflux pump
MSLSKLERIENKSVLKSIFIMALPVILGNIAQIIYNLTDAFFIGKLNDVAQLAAATFSYPLMMIMASIAAIFGIGGASYLSRSLGAKRHDLAQKTQSKALVTAFIVSIAIVIISQIFIDEIVKLLGSTGESNVYTKQYVGILTLAAPVIMLNTVSIDLIRAEGAARLASIGMIIGVTINLILDPIFIFTLGMEIKGAAIATVIGNGVAFIFSLFCYKYLTSVKFKLKAAFENSGILREIVKVGFPSALNIMLISISVIITNNISNSYGEVVVAGMGLAQRNHTIVIQILLGFSMGAQPLIGYNYGKKDYNKVKNLILTNISLICVLATVMSVTFFIFAEELISVFNSDPGVIANGARGLRAMLLMKPVIGLFMVTMNSAMAMGKGLITFVLSVLRQLILYMIIVNLLNHYLGYDGFIYGQTVSDFIIIIIASVILFIMLNNLKKEKPFIPLSV